MRNIIYCVGFLLIFLISMECEAQENKISATNKSSSTPKRWQFHSINQFGFLEGDAGAAFQMQTINGVQYKSWFGGIGVGIDNYRFRSIPLFADFRKEFQVGKNYLFVYGGIGVHFIWLTEKQKDEYHQDYYLDDNFSNGLYYDAGIGYKVPLNNKVAIIVSPGFSHKSTESKTSTVICPFYGPCYPNANNYAYAMSRLSVNIGVVF